MLQGNRLPKFIAYLVTALTDLKGDYFSHMINDFFDSMLIYLIFLGFKVTKFKILTESDPD